MDIDIVLSAPVALSQMGIPPYNPFLIIDQDRTREVHMINDPPTSKASFGFFNTMHDDSNPGSGRYYTSQSNLPWVINVVDKFDYTIEKVPINQGYSKFIPWSLSGGTQYFDWFKTNNASYRNASNIFQR